MNGLRTLKKLDLVISTALLVAAAVVSVALAILFTPKVLLVTIPAWVVVYALWEGLIWIAGVLFIKIGNSAGVVSGSIYGASQSLRKAVLYPDEARAEDEAEDDEYDDDVYDEENWDDSSEED